MADVRDALVETYADRWTTTPGLASLCVFTDFLGPVTSMLEDDVVKAGLGDVGGVPAGRVVAEGTSMTVTVWVRVAEPHLVLRVGVERGEPDGSTRTMTTFSDVDSTVDVDFPAPEEIVAFEVPTGQTSPDGATIEGETPEPVVTDG